MTRRIPRPDQCTIPSCERRRDRPADLTCLAHWKMVPRKLKVAFWNATKLKSLKAHEWATIVAATNIVDYLDKKKVLLPSDVTIARPESELETPKDATPRIIRP